MNLLCDLQFLLQFLALFNSVVAEANPHEESAKPEQATEHLHSPLAAKLSENHRTAAEDHGVCQAVKKLGVKLSAHCITRLIP